nr:uncharacterized protein LOC124815879 [Hydra vulgaris]
MIHKIIFMISLNIIFIIVISVIKTSGLQCYECITDSDENCLFHQKIKNCSRYENTCITVSYGYEIEGPDFSSYESFFEKQCHNSLAESCFHRRRVYEETGIKKPKVSCCKTNLCNKAVKEINFLKTYKNQNLKLSPKLPIIFLVILFLFEFF